MKNNKLETRKQKLSFLKDLSTGKASIEDINPMQVSFWTRGSNEENWTNEVTGEVITPQELEARKEKAKRTDSIVWLEELFMEEKS